MPLISVIMPCYNEERNIGNSIESILNQTFKDFELIIIDDSSTDNSVNVINSYNDQRIKLIQKSENSGVANSLNLGLQSASGKYIARMDADDLSNKERLKKQLEYMENNKDVILVGSWGFTINPITNTTKEIRRPETDLDIRKYFQKDNPFIHTSVLFKSFIPNKSFQYSEIKGFEDYDLWLRMSKFGKLANIPEFLVTRYDADNFNTKKTWSGIKKVDIYKKRLDFQLKAIKRDGLYYKTPIYLLKTIISIVLIKLRNI
jgi:glycosyltransferase involved in cell wall biosynthesis